MVVLALIALWIFIALLTGFHLRKSPKVRAWAVVLWHSKKIRIVLVALASTIVLVALAFILHPAMESTKSDSRGYFISYTREALQRLEQEGVIAIDSACDLSAPMPELAYALPAVLDAYRKIVTAKKPAVPRLVQLNDTLKIYFDGYKQFKNRGIRLTREIKKKLGMRYPAKMESSGNSHGLVLLYVGEAWDNEQLLGLPVLEASIREHVDPALLMSIMRHISGFDFDYESGNRQRGLLALDSGTGLDQVFMGAQKLRSVLDESKTLEDAIAQFYPMRSTLGLTAEWREEPAKKAWVNEVLSDIPFYKGNGLFINSRHQ